MQTSIVNITWSPNRVVIDDEGHVAPAKYARDRGIVSDIIFIRQDGWSLGSPKEFEDIAYNMHPNLWDRFTTKENLNILDIEEYQKSRHSIKLS